MDELKSSGKPFQISKQEVWDAWIKVKGNKGAPGVDGQSIAAFEADLKGNLYRIWNRMSSGTYFPPPVRAVEIPKPHGGGTRVLGVPTVADRIAQTVVAARLEAEVEPFFHPDTYGYRQGKSQQDAVAACRRRCWGRTGCSIWTSGSSSTAFPGTCCQSGRGEHYHETRWVVLYVKRWLKAPLQLPTGPCKSGTRNPPRVGNFPVLANLFMHYAFDTWLGREFPGCRSSVTLMILSIALRQRGTGPRGPGCDRTSGWRSSGLELHPERQGRVLHCEHERGTWTGRMAVH